jgi:hypothetical protein
MGKGENKEGKKLENEGNTKKKEEMRKNGRKKKEKEKGRKKRRKEGGSKESKISIRREGQMEKQGNKLKRANVTYKKLLLCTLHTLNVFLLYCMSTCYLANTVYIHKRGGWYIHECTV